MLLFRPDTGSGSARQCEGARRKKQTREDTLISINCCACAAYNGAHGNDWKKRSIGSHRKLSRKGDVPNARRLALHTCNPSAVIFLFLIRLYRKCSRKIMEMCPSKYIFGVSRSASALRPGNFREITYPTPQNMFGGRRAELCTFLQKILYIRNQMCIICGEAVLFSHRVSRGSMSRYIHRPSTGYEKGQENIRQPLLLETKPLSHQRWTLIQSRRL